MYKRVNRLMCILNIICQNKQNSKILCVNLSNEVIISSFSFRSLAISFNSIYFFVALQLRTYQEIYMKREN